MQLYIQPITDVDGTLDCFRFGVSSSANGLVIGATVMEGFYVVFDRAQRRLGFALSSCAGKSTYRAITDTEMYVKLFISRVKTSYTDENLEFVSCTDGVNEQLTSE